MPCDVTVYEDYEDEEFYDEDEEWFSDTAWSELVEEAHVENHRRNDEALRLRREAAQRRFEEMRERPRVLFAAHLERLTPKNPQLPAKSLSTLTVERLQRWLNHRALEAEVAEHEAREARQLAEYEARYGDGAA